MVETISYGIEGNGRKLKKILFFVGKVTAHPPSPIWMGHRDGTLGPIVDREGDNKGISLQDLDGRGEC